MSEANRQARPAPAEKTDDSIAGLFADFALGLRYDDIPETVRQTARRHILDSIGLSLAAQAGTAPKRLVGGLAPFSTGRGRILGFRERLDTRDAALLNGLLIHGLDFDDTHMASVMHVSSSCLPAAIAAIGLTTVSGRDVIEAFIIAVEIAARLGQATGGVLQARGFHPTGLLAGFGASVAFGRQLGLGRDQLVMAQGTALAGAPAATRQFNLEGSWTKWLSPGLGASSGLTAALIASSGFKAPSFAYEGRYGIFATHLENEVTGMAAGEALRRLGETLGSVWMTADLAIKPVPACLFLHAPVEAAQRLHFAMSVPIDDIEHVEVALPVQAFPVVCEPADRKRMPQTAFEAQFSIYHAVAAALHHGRFTLEEISPDVLSDPAIAALRERVNCVVDPQADYPRRFTARVTCRLRSGASFSHDIRDNLGSPTRPLSDDDVILKFIDNNRALPEAAVRDCIAMVLQLEDLADAATLLDCVEALGQHSRN